VVGDIAFGKDGEWVKPRSFLTQWQNLSTGDLQELSDLKKWVVIWPPEHKTGEPVYPFSATRK